MTRGVRLSANAPATKYVGNAHQFRIEKYPVDAQCLSIAANEKRAATGRGVLWRLVARRIVYSSQSRGGEIFGDADDFMSILFWLALLMPADDVAAACYLSVPPAIVQFLEWGRHL